MEFITLFWRYFKISLGNPFTHTNFLLANNLSPMIKKKTFLWRYTYLITEGDFCVYMIVLVVFLQTLTYAKKKNRNLKKFLPWWLPYKNANHTPVFNAPLIFKCELFWKIKDLFIHTSISFFILVTRSALKRVRYNPLIYDIPFCVWNTDPQLKVTIFII